MFRLKLKRKKVFTYESGKIYKADSIELMKRLRSNSIDAVLCDPPYALSFLGRVWDTFKNPKEFQKWNERWAIEAYRILKPGGHMLVFGGTRTFHRMVSGLEDAGFEIRDTILYLYGSGMPHGYNIGQSLEKLATLGRARRKDRDLGGKDRNRFSDFDSGGSVELTNELAIKYDGYNSALKPSVEPISMVRKPLSEKNLADNIIKWGTGGINIDACRVPLAAEGEDKRLGGKGKWSTKHMKQNWSGGWVGNDVHSSPKGRYPANVIIDDSEEVKGFFLKIGIKKSGSGKNTRTKSSMGYSGKLGKVGDTGIVYGDEGSVARFFYCSKTSNKEKAGSNHPTQKPINLMRYLVKLIAPPDALILDPFAGSNSTGIAAAKEGFKFIGIEKDRKNFEGAIIKTKHHLGIES